MSNSSSLPICQFLGDANWTPFFEGKEDYTGRKHNRVPRGTECQSGTSEVLEPRPERNCLRGSRCNRPVAGILERVEPEGIGITVPCPKTGSGSPPSGVWSCAGDSPTQHSPPQSTDVRGAQEQQQQQSEAGGHRRQHPESSTAVWRGPGWGGE